MGSRAVQLRGCEIYDEDTSVQEAQIVDSLVLQPGGIAVVAEPGAQLDAAVESDLTLSSAEVLSLRCGAVVVDLLDYRNPRVAFPPEPDASVALELDPSAYDAALNDDGSAWCLSTTTGVIPMSGDLGSPGQHNAACPP